MSLEVPGAYLGGFVIDPASSSTQFVSPARVFGVLEDVVARRLAGEELPDEMVMDRHRELMPLLGDLLRELRQVERARRAAQSSAGAGGSDALRLDRAGEAGASRPPFSTGTIENALPGYQVVRELHRGGQGVVYLAVQQSTRREVAVKVLREGPFVGRQHLARFEREVQILAHLRHPNIVSIHDSGIAPTGQFYFVMDFIAGEPLDGHLTKDAAGRSLDRRLRLFERVCEAVHAAHLRGVIHRDLKPSNIRIDEAGEPHILDFGLARLVEEEDGDDGSEAGLTVTGQFVGSLPWASPEQAEGTVTAIDLRTDVYALGVILYQMLTGQFPYAVTGGMHAVLQNILRAEPMPPRAANPRIDEDLQTIVLKCLAKAPERRYEGAGELAKEIGRYRAGEAIEARRDSTGYVLRKALRRHWAPASVAVGFVLIIASSAVWLGFLYAGQSDARDRAEAEAEKSNQVVQFLQDMLGSADPHLARGKEVTVQEVLDEAAARVEEGFDDEPEVAAAVHRTIGRTYLSLSRFAEAERQFEAALDLAQEALGDEHEETLEAMTGLASSLEAMDRFDDAQPMYERVLEVSRRTQGDESPPAITALHNLGNLHHNRGRFADAEALLSEALEVSTRTHGSEDPETLVTRKVLARVWRDMGRPDEAERELRAVLEAQQRVVGQDAPETRGTASELAILLKDAGRLAEAEPLYRELVEAERRVHGKRHAETLLAMNSLGRLLQAQGRLEEAEAIVRETLDTQREVLGEEHSDTLITTNNLSLLLQEMGRLAEAEPLARRVEEVGRRVLGDEHPDVLVWVNNLGNLLYRQGRYGEGEACYQRVLEARRRILGEDHQATLMALANLGNVFTEMGRLEEAEAVAREALERRRTILGPEHPETLMSVHNLSLALHRAGRLAEAETVGREALEARRRTRGEDHPDTILSMLNLGRILVDAGRNDEALGVLEAGLQGADAQLPEGHAYRASLKVTMGKCLVGLQRWDEAEAQLVAGCEAMQASPGPAHPRTQECIAALVALYQSRGQSEKAEAWRARLAR